MQSTNVNLRKNFLIYGLGKSGISSLKYLHKKNNCYIFDDNKKKINKKLNKFFISKSKLIKKNFDNIILSPGIDSKKCYLSNYLKKNKTKIITDLDIFYKFNTKLKYVTITGTNGKSTISKLLYNILKDQGFDARLTGNIGNPILNEKKINKNTIVVVEASSYQLAYSKNFKSNISIFLNIAPDHLERHFTMNNYINAKLKSVTKQNKNDFSIISDDDLLRKALKNKSIKSKIIFLKKNKHLKLKKKIKNNYFKNPINYQNIEFLFELTKHFKINLDNVLKTINNFKSLKYRHQLIYKSKKFEIINDSKSTTLSSTTPFLEINEKIYWILGGLYKKGDKFNLKKIFYKNISAYIYGKDKNIFYKLLKDKVKISLSKNLQNALKMITKDIKKEKAKIKILFSPAAASFDQFKNFEDRGKKFNFLARKNFLNK